MELTGRSGGRLEAFFLDEGFGSLDAATLDLALAELERR
jgi:exonuclease SbcC